VAAEQARLLQRCHRLARLPLLLLLCVCRLRRRRRRIPRRCTCRCCWLIGCTAACSALSSGRRDIYSKLATTLMIAAAAACVTPHIAVTRISLLLSCHRAAAGTVAISTTGILALGTALFTLRLQLTECVCNALIVRLQTTHSEVQRIYLSASPICSNLLSEHYIPDYISRLTRAGRCR
jgi:hypothetical protein